MSSKGLIELLPEDEFEEWTDRRIRSRDRVTVARTFQQMREIPPEGIALVGLVREEDRRRGELEYVCRFRKGPAVTSFDRRLIFEMFYGFPPIAIDELVDQLPQRLRIHAGLGVVPPATWQAVLVALNALRPEASGALERLQGTSAPPAWTRRSAGRIVGYERDAVQLSAKLAGVEDPRSVNNWRVSEQPASFLSGLRTASVREDSLIQSDMNVFGDWQRLQQFQTGVVEFIKDGRRLTVANVNRTPLEQTLGADLIYYTDTYQAFTLVQYKMLSREGDSLIYRPSRDASLEDELARLTSIPEAEWDEGPLSYRLGPGSCFLKFCYREVSPFDTSLARGLYLPLELWLALAGSADLRGPRGGVLLNPDTLLRHLPNTDFVSLVSNGWVGSRGATSDLLQQTIEESLESGRSVTLARSSEASGRDSSHASADSRG